MSMHDIEHFIEMAIIAVDESALPIPEKRNLIYTLLILEDFGDCGFTHCRTTKQMVNSSYTFLFDKTEMWDYKNNADFYEELNEESMSNNGDLYVYEDYDEAYPEANGKVCVDSGSSAWEQMVAAGKITGEGARPVTRLGSVETFRTAKFLIEKQQGILDSYGFSGMSLLFSMSDAMDEIEEMPRAKSIARELFGITLDELLEGEFDDIEPTGEANAKNAPKVPARVFKINGQLIPFALDNDYWKDKSLIINGYLSTVPYVIKQNKRQVKINLRYISDGLPLRYNAYAIDKNPILWLETADDDLADINAYNQYLLKLLEQLNINDDYRRFYNYEKLIQGLMELTEQMSHSAVNLPKLARLFNNIIDALSGNDLPNELINETDPFTVLFVLLNGALERVRALSAANDNEKECADNTMMLERCSAVIGEKLERHLKIIETLSPRMPKDIQRSEELIAQLNGLSEPPKWEDNTRRVELLREIWHSPGANLHQRKKYADILMQSLVGALNNIQHYHNEAIKRYQFMPEVPEIIKAFEAKLIQLQDSPPNSRTLTLKHNSIDGITFEGD